MSDELLFILTSQVRKYRAIQMFSPKTSDSYKAAKVTVDATQRTIDWLINEREVIRESDELQDFKDAMQAGKGE